MTCGIGLLPTKEQLLSDIDFVCPLGQLSYAPAGLVTRNPDLGPRLAPGATIFCPLRGLSSRGQVRDGIRLNENCFSVSLYDVNPGLQKFEESAS